MCSLFNALHTICLPKMDDKENTSLSGTYMMAGQLIYDQEYFSKTTPHAFKVLNLRRTDRSSHSVTNAKYPTFQSSEIFQWDWYRERYLVVGFPKEIWVNIFTTFVLGRVFEGLRRRNNVPIVLALRELSQYEKNKVRAIRSNTHSLDSLPIVLPTNICKSSLMQKTF